MFTQTRLEQTTIPTSNLIVPVSVGLRPDKSEPPMRPWGRLGETTGSRVKEGTPEGLGRIRRSQLKQGLLWWNNPLTCDEDPPFKTLANAIWN
jgi:hypothetical protein